MLKHDFKKYEKKIYCIYLGKKFHIYFTYMLLELGKLTFMKILKC